MTPTSSCPHITVNQGDGTSVRQYAYVYIVAELDGAASTYWPMIGYLLIVRHSHHTPHHQHRMHIASIDL